MATLIRMLHLEWMFFKLSAITDLQMRFNLIMQFLNDVLWYTVQVILYEAVYLHVGSLGGWGVAEARVFLGVVFLVDGLQMVLFAYNFDYFSDKVIRGELDMLLLKPVSSLQLFTCQRLQCGYLLNVILALAWLGWALAGLPGGFPWCRVALLLVVVPAGLSVFYATRLIFNLPALMFKQSGDFQGIYFSLFRLGLRPDKLYGPGLRYLVLMVIPVGMIASVPTRVLVDPFNGWLMGGLVGGSLFMLVLSNRLWHYGLRKYARAS